MDILKHIIPLICILTIHDNETSFIEMYKYIELSQKHYQILIDQTKSWWGDLIDSVIVKKFINIYIKYMSDDTETNQIIRTIKELFMKNITNMKELSCLIDKYFIPQELEKKTNAEVSTPHKLRHEMLDKIPLYFWTSPIRVFEPCAGKGGFLIDIIDRFMIGLSSIIPDEKIRYKVIVEECLYFSDINPTNIFICKLLIDPYNEYSLHWNEGNTLELNIQEKWGIDGFHAVIGNPPYQNTEGSGDNKLYLEFIKSSFEKWLLLNAYLLFITPTNIKNYITNIDKNRKYINNFYEIQYLSLNTANKYFKFVSTYFAYFLIKNNIVSNCRTTVSFLRNKKNEFDEITIFEKQVLPLCLSNIDFNILNKCSNIISETHNTFYITKASYQIKNRITLQRIRKTHIENGEISIKETDLHKYKIIDKINIGNPFPGNVYFNKYIMIEYGLPKIIMCTGGYLMPSYDTEGKYNLSDNMIYMLCDSEIKYDGFVKLVNSNLIKYINLITMTDNIHGRDFVIEKIKKINLEYIKDDESIYEEFNLTPEEIKLIEQTI